jgi:hypothetical protein
MTPSEFCNCVGHEVFGPLTQDELEEFARDIRKYGDDVGHHDPWESRVEIAVFRCFDVEK